MRDPLSIQEVRSISMPYCVQQLSDGRWIILNRKYKPLGVDTSDWIDYATHATADWLNITPAKARAISYRPSTDASFDPTCLYLYNDGCIPTRSASSMAAYLKRLGSLMKVHIKTPYRVRNSLEALRNAGPFH